MNLAVTRLWLCAVFVFTTISVHAETCLQAPVVPPKASQVNIDDIRLQLEGSGLAGSVHGAVGRDSVFVFTWRHPDNFFVNIQFPMTSMDPLIQVELLSLQRHDRVTLRGKFIAAKAPIQHIEVTEILAIDKWAGLGSDIKFDHQTKIEQDIVPKSSLIVKVHAVVNGGSVLVVEYGDLVVPVFNRRPELAANLFRNDKIRLEYTSFIGGGQTRHLAVDEKSAQPICLLERIQEGAGEPITLTGSLVKFPQSPQIRFDVFALRTEDSDGIQRNYTLLNFDFDAFKLIREKIGAAWDKHQMMAIYDRNKFLNPRLKITAKGTKAVFTPNQANPQILLESADDVSIEFL